MRLANRFGWVLGGNLVSQAALFFLIPLVVSFFGAKVYGNWIWGVALANICLPLMTLRLELFAMASRDREAVASAGVVVVGMIVLVCLVFLLADALFDVNASGISVTGVVALLAGNAMFTFSNALLSEEGLVKSQAILKIVRVVVGVAVCGLLGWLIGRRAEAIYLGMTSGFFVALGITAWNLSRSRWKMPASLPDRAQWREMKPFVVFNVPHSWVGALGSNIPIVFIGHRYGPVAASYYGLAWQYLISPVQVIATSFSQSALQDGRGGFGSRQTKLILATAGFTLFLAFVLSFLYEWLGSVFTAQFGITPGALEAILVFCACAPMVLMLGSMAYVPILLGKQKENLVFELVYLVAISSVCGISIFAGLGFEIFIVLVGVALILSRTFQLFWLYRLVASDA
ncbi:MAG: oligosaccharide flippase family protein [Fibrobacteres bacterium]|nr:oligosaccharide flippase family protein [Fibrobacterota bacterium]